MNSLDDEAAEASSAQTNSFRFQMIERPHTRYVPVLPADNPTSVTMEQHLAAVLEELEKRRAGLVREVDPVSAFADAGLLDRARTDSDGR